MSDELDNILNSIIKSTYDEIINNCEHLLVGFEKTDEKFSLITTLQLFDVAIQYSMIEVCFGQQNDINAKQMTTIMKLTKFGDFSKFLSYCANKNYTWQEIYDKKHDMLKTFFYVDEFRNNLIQDNNKFCECFAALDFFNDDKNLLFTLVKKIEELNVKILGVGNPPKVSKVPDTSYALIFQILENVVLEKKKLEERTIQLLKDIKQMNIKDLRDVISYKDLNKPTDLLVDYDNKEKAVAFILTDKGSGSGFMITSKGLCLTCAHVINEADKIEVRLGDDITNRRLYQANVVYKNKNEDFALLKLENCSNNYYFDLEEDFTKLIVGDDVSVYGFPFGTDLNANINELEPSLTKGYISSKNKVGGSECYYLDIKAAPGNSGGPVFSIKSKNVIGYLCGSYGDGSSNLIYIRTVAYFMNLIKDKIVLLNKPKLGRVRVDTMPGNVLGLKNPYGLQIVYDCKKEMVIFSVDGNDFYLNDKETKVFKDSILKLKNKDKSFYKTLEEFSTFEIVFRDGCGIYIAFYENGSIRVFFEIDNKKESIAIEELTDNYVFNMLFCEL